MKKLILMTIITFSCSIQIFAQSIKNQFIEVRAGKRFSKENFENITKFGTGDSLVQKFKNIDFSVTKKVTLQENEPLLFRDKNNNLVMRYKFVTIFPEDKGSVVGIDSVYIHHMGGRTDSINVLSIKVLFTKKGKNGYNIIIPFVLFFEGKEGFFYILNSFKDRGNLFKKINDYRGDEQEVLSLFKKPKN